MTTPSSYLYLQINQYKFDLQLDNTNKIIKIINPKLIGFKWEPYFEHNMNINKIEWKDDNVSELLSTPQGPNILKCQLNFTKDKEKESDNQNENDDDNLMYEYTKNELFLHRGDPYTLNHGNHKVQNIIPNYIYMGEKLLDIGKPLNKFILFKYDPIKKELIPISIHNDQLANLLLLY